MVNEIVQTNQHKKTDVKVIYLFNNDTVNLKKFLVIFGLFDDKCFFAAIFNGVIRTIVLTFYCFNLLKTKKIYHHTALFKLEI